MAAERLGHLLERLDPTAHRLRRPRLQKTTGRRAAAVSPEWDARERAARQSQYRQQALELLQRLASQMAPPVPTVSLAGNSPAWAYEAGMGAPSKMVRLMSMRGNMTYDPGPTTPKKLPPADGK